MQTDTALEILAPQEQSNKKVTSVGLSARQAPLVVHLNDLSIN